MSTTTASPRSRTRSPTSWCGEAPFGPEPTMTKSTRDVALVEDRRRRSRAPTSRSVRPGRRNSAIRRVHPVDRLPGAAQRVDLVGGLAHPQLADAPPTPGVCSAPGQRGPHPQHLLGPHPVGQRRPAGRRAAGAAISGVRVVRLAPAHAPRCRVPARATPAPPAPRAAGATRNGSPVGRAGPGRSAARAAARRSRSASAGRGRASRSSASRPASAAAFCACDTRSGDVR